MTTFNIGDKVQWPKDKTRHYKRPVQVHTSYGYKAPEPIIFRGVVVELVSTGARPTVRIFGLPSRNHDSCVVKTTNGFRCPPMSRLKHEAATA